MVLSGEEQGKGDVTIISWSLADSHFSLDNVLEAFARITTTSQRIFKQFSKLRRERQKEIERRENTKKNAQASRRYKPCPNAPPTHLIHPLISTKYRLEGIPCPTIHPLIPRDLIHCPPLQRSEPASLLNLRAEEESLCPCGEGSFDGTVRTPAE